MTLSNDRPPFGESQEGFPPAAEPGPAPRTATQIILAHFYEGYRPRFRRGHAVRCAGGEVLTRRTACALLDSRLLEQLATASDAPRYAGPRGRPGEVNRNALPGLFRTWARVAWGDLLGELPVAAAPAGVPRRQRKGGRRRAHDGPAPRLT